MILRDKQRANVVVRGLIFQEDHLLATQWRTDGIAFCIGGRVEFGEPLIETLHREVREEAGVEVVAYRLVYFAENIFTGADGFHYHEYGWYFWVEPDRPVCRLDEVIPNPDHPDLTIRYLPLSEEGLRNLWPSFLRRYLPADWPQRFADAPRYLHSRDAGGDGEVEVRELAGLFERR
jgi:8-oxo-dGTP pyrophosphatase MutT (NUDIX family)